VAHERRRHGGDGGPHEVWTTITSIIGLLFNTFHVLLVVMQVMM
jgi:hypothetical protein